MKEKKINLKSGLYLQVRSEAAGPAPHAQVWLNMDQDFDGLCIATGVDLAEAVAGAVEMLEEASGALIELE